MAPGRACSILAYRTQVRGHVEGIPLIHAEHMLQHMLRKCPRRAKHMLESICSRNAQDMLNIYSAYTYHKLSIYYISFTSKLTLILIINPNSNFFLSRLHWRSRSVLAGYNCVSDTEIYWFHRRTHWRNSTSP